MKSTEDTNRWIQIGKEVFVVMDGLLTGWTTSLRTALDHFGPPICLSYRCIVVSLYHIFRCADAPKQGQKKANNRRLRLSLCPASRLPDFKIDSAAVRDSSAIPKSQTGFVSFSFGLKINKHWRAVSTAQHGLWPAIYAREFLLCAKSHGRSANSSAVPAPGIRIPT